MELDQIAMLLQRTTLFRGVAPHDLEAVAEIAEERSAPPGQHVFFQGDLATEFFVLVSGTIRVYVPGQGGELDVGVVRQGDIFGEGGMLDGGPRVASAVALEAATVLAIPRAPWLRLIDEIPDLAHRMFVAVGASVRRYASEAIDFLFIGVEIPEYPPGDAVPP